MRTWISWLFEMVGVAIDSHGHEWARLGAITGCFGEPIFVTWRDDEGGAR
jgi:hypothetical protein